MIRRIKHPAKERNRWEIKEKNETSLLFSD